jgi:hypothetical protein
MAKEIQGVSLTSGATYYAQVRTLAGGQIWNATTPAFEALTYANLSKYTVPTAEVVSGANGTGTYYGDFPVQIAVGRYAVSMFKQAGAAPAWGDLCIGVEDFDWDGAAAINGVLVGKSLDKSGYSLTQAFPANFAGLAIAAADGGVTVHQNLDKSNYVLTQTFPANFAALGINATDGGVIVHQNLDKSNYGITQTFPTNFAALAINASNGGVLVQQNNDKTNYVLTQPFPANFSALAIAPTTGYVSIGPVTVTGTVQLAANGLDLVRVEGVNARQALALVYCAETSKVSGAGGGAVAIRDQADTVDRITADVDASGNRLSVVLNPPA